MAGLITFLVPRIPYGLLSFGQRVGAISNYGSIRKTLIEQIDDQTGSDEISNVVLQSSKKIEVFLKREGGLLLPMALSLIDGQGVLDVVLLQMAKNGLDSLVELGGEMPPPGTDLLEAIADKLALISEGRSDLVEAIENLRGVETLDERKALLEPVVIEMLEVLLPDHARSIPVDVCPETIWNAIKEITLNLFVEGFDSSFSWIRKDPQLPMSVRKPETDNAFEDLATWTQDFAIKYLQNNCDDLSATLTDSIWGTASSGIEDLERDRVARFFQDCIKKCSCEEGPLYGPVRSAIHPYSKAAFLEIFSSLFQRTDELGELVAASGRKEWFSKRIVEVLKVTVDHFMRLNLARAELKLPRVDCLREENFNLYAIADEYTRPSSTIDGFFKPLVVDMLEIVNVTKANLPVPNPLKECVWGLLMEQLPKLVELLFNQVLDSKNLDGMLLNLVNNVNASMHARHEETPAAEPIDDDTQRDMNRLIGEFLQEFINTIPGTWTESILANDRVRRDTANSLGQMLRNHLESDWNLTEMIRLAMTNGIESLVSTDASRDPDVTEKLQKAIVEMLVEHTVILFESYISYPWSQFQKHLDRVVEATLGSSALSVKKCLDEFGALILGCIFYVALYPLRKLVEAILYWHINKKAAIGIDVMHVPIHKDLLLEITKNLVTSLKPTQVAAPQAKRWIF